MHYFFHCLWYQSRKSCISRAQLLAYTGLYLAFHLFSILNGELQTAQKALKGLVPHLMSIVHKICHNIYTCVGHFEVPTYTNKNR